jgi:coenzyme F420-0:L-glutamate ligase/coenzyme F420-1:gamma-L-glutamate ligase
MVQCAETLVVRALPGLPRVRPGDDVGGLIVRALREAGWTLQACDVLVVTSKVISRAEGRFVDVSQVTPSARARELAEVTRKDPRMVELILQESTHVSRAAPEVLVVRHRLGFVSANAGIDLSNALPPEAQGAAQGAGPWALLLPQDPDAAARALRARFEAEFGVPLGVVLSDSHGRPFRLGSVGLAVGVAGLPALHDQVGTCDLDGRPLERTVSALADQVACAADLVAGQAAEGRPVVLVRGLTFDPSERTEAKAMVRPAEQDLYA